MRPKELRIIVTFETTTAAMAFESEAKKRQIAGRLIPVPRSISASCGLSWCAPPTSRTALEKLLQEQDLDPEGIYECII